MIELNEVETIEVNLDEENKIDVDLDEDIKNLNDIYEIVSNENIRQQNESERVKYYNQIKQEVLDGKFKGEKGDKGEEGIQGPIGPPGPKGQDGNVQFEELTLEQKALLKGDKGDKGEQGESSIKLICISEEPPITADEQDKYYNNQDKKIYTYNTEWTNAEDPKEGIVYINLEDECLYYYNGEDMIKASSSNKGIYIGSEEPTDEDINFWIDPNEEPTSSTSEEDTGWIDANLKEGVTARNFGGSSVPQYRKIGSKIIIRGAVNFVHNGVDTLILFTLPTEMRPTNEVFSYQVGGSSSIARMSISPNGNVNIINIKKISDGSNLTSETYADIHSEFYL